MYVLRSMCCGRERGAKRTVSEAISLGRMNKRRFSVPSGAHHTDRVNGSTGPASRDDLLPEEAWGAVDLFLSA